MEKIGFMINEYLTGRWYLLYSRTIIIQGKINAKVFDTKIVMKNCLND